GSVAVTLLAMALLAPAAWAAPGNGNGNGGGNGQGHGRPADAGPSRARGHQSKPATAKPDKKAKDTKKAKAEKKAKPDKGPRRDGADAQVDGQQAAIEPAGTRGGPNVLVMLPCKSGGWQGLQRANGSAFEN